jgi:hypothetical protein
MIELSLATHTLLHFMGTPTWGALEKLLWFALLKMILWIFFQSSSARQQPRIADFSYPQERVLHGCSYVICVIGAALFLQACWVEGVATMPCYDLGTAVHTGVLSPTL